VVSLYNMSGTNGLTFALSDALHDNRLAVRLDEEGFLDCTVAFFQAPWDPVTQYACTIRIDRRPIPYYTAIKDIGDWWEAEGLTRCSAPDAASMPFFCTWYSHHGKVTQEDVILQARLAKPLGMDAIIVDGGWGVPLQARHKQFPDLPGTVKAVQDLGVKVLLWTDPSSPNDTNRDLFGGEMRIPGDAKKSRFDPRYPEVRAQWVKEYLHLLDVSGCDGFKIDFIGSISSAAEGDPDDPRRDFKSVPEAVDAAMEQIFTALRDRNPEILIEYRQNYNGPYMLQHCTMVRAIDCGNSYPDNRLRTCDTRLLSGRVPVHSDMIIWHPDESVVSAALQLQHTLFSVPQLSVRLETMPKPHLDMIKTYMAFWREHRDVILNGEFMPAEPQGMFPYVLSRTKEKLLVGVFANTVVRLPTNPPEEILIVNATDRDRVVLELSEDAGLARVATMSPTGENHTLTEYAFQKGLTCVAVPPGGYACCRLVSDNQKSPAR
jgi:alpha-galactosidase